MKGMIDMKKIHLATLVTFIALATCAESAQAECMNGYHCIKTGTCAAVASTCHDVAGVGIQVTVLGSGGGATTAFSYKAFGWSYLYVGGLQAKAGAQTHVYQMACGVQKYYLHVGCAGQPIGYQDAMFVSTCNIIPGQ